MNIKLPKVTFAMVLLIGLSPRPRCAAVATEDAPARPVSLQVVPQGVTLWGDKASQRFLVLATFADGMERDVTSDAHFSLSDVEKGDVDISGKFMARSNGQLSLTASFGGRSTETVIRIEGAGEKRPFSFGRDLGGIFTKRGCNATDCHGGVKGRGGFKLSLNSLQPRDDFRWTVEGGTFQVLSAESKGPRIPRIDLKEPEKSLLLLKPTRQVAHEGGRRFQVGSADYEAVLNWIRAGAPYGGEAGEKGASVERIEVFPKELVLDAGGRHRLLVTAHLSNGRREDITDQALYLVNNPGVVELSEEGVVQAQQTGESAVLIQAAGHTASARVGVIEKPLADYPNIDRRNYIDELVFAKLRKFNLPPSPKSSDEEFLRRICLDLTGTLPPPNRVREFLADTNPRKRDDLIEALLDSPEFVDYWAFRFGDLFRVTFVTSNDLKGTKGYEDWVVNGIASDKPYDQIARERIAAQGYAAPARNFFYVTELQPPAVVMPELVRVFLGRRMECAQCHDHPFETWSQNQFWGLAAFFGGLTELQDSKLLIDALAGHVDQPREMKVIHPRTKETVVPAFLDGTRLPQSQWDDPRMRLAESITSQPAFAEAAANRVWGYMFGRGIVDPVDDFRTSNPATHPELLDALAKDLRTRGFHLKQLLRTIAQSQTYQLTGAANKFNQGDRINYSRSQPRALEAAELLDAISSVTGVAEDFKFHKMAGGGNPPPGTRAMQMVPDLCPSQFMDAYGRSMRKTPGGGDTQPNLTQALHMLAGPTYTTKISKLGGRLDQLLKSNASDAEVIEEFYLAALTRFPTLRERSALQEFLGERAARRQEALEGMIWAIISSREFAYNH